MTCSIHKTVRCHVGVIVAHPVMSEEAIDEMASRLDLLPLRYQIGGGPERVTFHERPNPQRIARGLMRRLGL